MDPPPPPSAESTTSTTTTTGTSVTLPRLAVLTPSKSHAFQPPSKRIHTAADLSHFLSSLAYRDIGLFLLQLNRALCPRKPDPQQQQQQTQADTPSSNPHRLPPPQARARQFPLDAPRSDPPAVVSLRNLLSKLEAFIDEAPPEQGPRRFGNPAFRKWHALLEERVDGLLKEHIPAEVFEAWGGEELVISEVRPYFVGGFGSKERLDYGTGHELSFFAFLGCLWKLGAFGDGSDKGDGEVERSLVLGVFEPYLKVIRRLILTYTLEPAGSHGVWGLDDHSFLPYIFGSAQLTRPISGNEPMPLEGSVPGAPKPADILKPDTVARLRTANMYFSAIGFINDVKTGPFWEHSPVLFDVSGIRDGWGKINKGMIKMFNAEVLSKFPVVQHFPFGSLFSWDRDPGAATSAAGLATAAQTAGSGVAAGSAGTAAPWAQATQMPGAVPGVPPGPGIPYSRVPWANNAPTPRGGGGTGLPGAGSVPVPRGGVPNTGPPPPTAFPRGQPGTASNQFAVTKAPWAKD